MAVPALTALERTAALEKAKVARRERSELLTRLKRGEIDLASVLDKDGDDLVGKTLVVRLLKALPGVGPVRAGELLVELGISESRRVRGLGPRQRERLLKLFPPQR